MALYFESRVANEATVRTTCTRWHNLHSLLAVGTSANRIAVFNEEAEAQESMVVERDAVPTCLDWHPMQRILVAGWSDGGVSLYADHDKGVREDKTIHKRDVATIQWSPDGTRLISTDLAGTICVWKTDDKYRLKPISQYNTPSAQTQIAFRCPAVVRHEGVPAQLPVTCPPFFVGGEAGVVYFADDQGHCSEAFNMDGEPIAALRYYEQKDSIIVITQKMQMARYKIGSDGSIAQDGATIKLSSEIGPDANFHAVWIGPGLLATSSMESMVRVWNIASNTEDNYTLSPQDPRCNTRDLFNPADAVSAIDYHPSTRTLAMAVREGRLVMWRYVGPDNTATSTSESWDPLLPPTTIEGRLTNVAWGPGSGRVMASSPESTSILTESVMNRRIKNGVAAFQVSTDRMLYQRIDASGEPVDAALPIRSNTRIRGMDVTAKHCAVWSGKKVEIYELGEVASRIVSAFQSKATLGALHGESLYLCVENRIEVTNFQGQVKQTLPFTQQEGPPVAIDVSGQFLVAASQKGVIKVWDLSRREAKQHGSPVTFSAVDGSRALIRSVRSNVDGTFVSILAVLYNQAGHRRPDSNVYVFDVEAGVIFAHDFGPDAHPTAHFWDGVEKKLFGCEVKSTKQEDDSTGLADLNLSGVDGAAPIDPRGLEVFMLFATPGQGINMQDSFRLTAEQDAPLGVYVPNVFFVGKTDGEHDSATARLLTASLRDFVGMGVVDETSRSALLNFSYYLTVGNMDEAYKAVKLIKSSTVWENMARMCVKTRRLDVAEVCFGNMGHARGARAVREARAAGLPVEAQVAVVAIHLGMIEDAQALYKACDRYDLLNVLYTAAGLWDKAIAVANKHDRIHLKTTHYQQAKYLESIGDMVRAIDAYEASNCHRFEVPRMLYEQGMINDLQAYVERSDDPAITRWWAQYCESTGAYDRALEYYTQANDHLAIVRIHCFQGDFDRAAHVATESNDNAAAFHLAQQYEKMDRISEAVSFYTRAQRFSHAARLAKANNSDDELLTLALQSNPSEMIESAHYFEEKGQYDKAVTLYQRSGNVAAAVDLCFRAELFDSLSVLADELGENTDPQLLRRCVAFFLEHNQHDKAVMMYITAKDYEQAIDLAEQRNVIISDEMAEGMTPEKSDNEAANAARTSLLLRLARLLERQGSYNKATKVYTKANKRVDGMKCLLKSGDTEKIIFFAEICRNKELYILAANYLQTLSWHDQPDVMKALITFYTKARAYDQLGSFYEACSTVEIDEYRNYEKALGALREAHKWMDKSKAVDKGNRLAALQTKIGHIETFVQARKLAATNREEMIALCQQLIDGHDVEASIRIGDVFAHLIEFHYSEQNFEAAYALIEQMEQRKIATAPFLDADMVAAIYRGVGAEAPAAAPADSSVAGISMDEDDAQGFVEEELIDDDEIADAL